MAFEVVVEIDAKAISNGVPVSDLHTVLDRLSVTIFASFIFSHAKAYAYVQDPFAVPVTVKQSAMAFCVVSASF